MSETSDKNAQLSPVKRAIVELRRARGRIEALERAKSEPIAIIGAGLRFPGGANDLENFWRLLRDGIDTVTEVPADRWDIEAFYDPDPDAPGKMSTRWGSFLDDVDKFDADFFGISPREAVTMDPQQRLLMTVAWEALENAGQSPQRLMGSSTGVFVGIAGTDYLQMQLQRSSYEEIDAYLASGSCHSVAAGRLSYFLGLQGPSIAVDTACSSSLVATHLACQSLRSGECNLALAGGVNLILSPEMVINFSKARMMAADGRCKVFDAAADGYVRGEGAGIVVLKRLSDAEKDGDLILAVIRGSAVNQDGRSNGLTAPNGPAQQAVIRQALSNAEVKSAEVDFVETHGTGTALGDPIEVQALAAALGEGRGQDRPLTIASIKTNIGHLESAAGVAGLMKVVAALQHEEIPPHLHFKDPNPYILWRDLPVRVPAVSMPWPTGERRRIAGVSSFGFSGTNAHVAMEEAPVKNIGRAAQEMAAAGERDFPRRPLHLLPLSAKTGPALKELARRYERYLADHPELAIADVCYTASAGRAHFEHRMALVGASGESMRQKLAAFAAGEQAAHFSGVPADDGRPNVVFLFTGDHGDCVNAGRTLFESAPGFRAILEQCDARLRPYLDRPLLSILYPEPGASFPLDDSYARSALFSIAYALAELWRSWGIVPALVVGHGLGEIAAATVAGMMSLEEGLILATRRGNEFARQISNVSFKAPAIAPFSTRSFKTVTSDDLSDPSYWLRDASGSGQLEAAIESLAGQGYRIVVEFGPASVLSDRLQKLLIPRAGACLPSFRRGRNDWEQMLETLAALYARGVNVDWDSFYRHDAARKVALPTYPFLPRKFWIEPPKSREKSPKDRAQPKLWEAVVAAAQQQSRQVPLDLALHTYAAKWHSLDHLTTAYIVQNLRELGAFTTPREEYSVDTLLERCGILPTYKVLMARWLKKLAAEGWLQDANGNYLTAEPGRELQIDALLRDARQELADIPFLVEYLERCGELAGAVLTGRISALETLFPAGSTDFAEKLYQHWAYSRYYNTIIRAAVDGIVRSWPHGRQLSCVEIGAGTGGTTAAILPVLPPDLTFYRFTDVSEFFFSRAAEKFREYPFVCYGILDIERIPAEQGYGQQQFDIVVAANVLHATRDIRATIDRVMSLLRPGGILLLYEVTTPPAWSDISIALIEGWQVFNDGLRPDSPLLNQTQWHEALRTAGFADVQSYPEARSPAEVLGAHIILACMPGVQGVQQQLAREDALDGNVITRSLSLSEGRGNGGIPAATTHELLHNLREASEVERREMLVEYVRGQVAKVLRREDSDPIERRRRLMDLGIDSLMAVQLRNLLGSGLGLKQPLPATLIFNYPTVEVIAAYLEKQIFGAAKAASLEAPPSDENSHDPNTADMLTGLSEEQVADLLLKKLETL